MKFSTYVLFGMLSITAAMISNKAQAQPGFSFDISFNSFHNELSPYGRWLNLPRYGQVWSYNEPGFRPYATNGQWEDTDAGWYWNSNYSWGQIPFHYGRWELDPYYGWIWIPGYDYAPAWVVWSQADDYYGWAPLGYGCDINVSFGRIPANRWMYASAGNIYQPHIDRYCAPVQRNDFYYGRQRAIGNVYTQHNVRYMAGPRREQQLDRNYPSQRGPVRGERDDNRGGYQGNRSYERNERAPQPASERPMRVNPSVIDRRGAIAENRPAPQVARPGREEAPAPRMQPMQQNRRFNDAPARTQPVQQPQRVFSQPAQRQASPSGNSGQRPMGGVGRDRRIF